MPTFDIHLEDSLKGLKNIPDNSIDFCLTDPPYFIDGMGNDWNPTALADRADKKKDTKGVVGGLPKGQKFDPEQGKKFQEFMHEISKEIIRILKPGGFYLSFSQARLYHRLGVAVEDAGFEVRDMIGWVYTKGAMTKAFKQDSIVNKNKSLGLSKDEKDKLLADIGGRKTPQLKPAIEPICLAQKPTDGLNIENWMKYQTGLIDMSQRVGDDKDPANIVTTQDIDELSVFVVNKPTKKEKGDYNNHMTVKPIELCEHLIRIFSIEGATVLDPFNGSGTTGLAAFVNNRNYIGFDINQEYIDISMKRLEDIKNAPTIKSDPKPEKQEKPSFKVVNILED